ncbi:MAG: QueT transporter family protein [Culicoidibacterales bacterium]
MKLKIKDLAQIAIIAALYIVMTLIVPFSFGPIQFRISEFLNFLVIFDKKYAIGVIIGVFIANLFSLYGLDLLFGTMHTIISFAVCLIAFKFIANRLAKYIVVTVAFSLLIVIIAGEIMIINQSLELFWPVYISLIMSEVAVLLLGGIIMWQLENLLRKTNFLTNETNEL